MTVVDCPKCLDENTVMPLLVQIRHHYRDPDLVIDLSELGFVMPFGTLVAASILHSVQNCRRNEGLRPFSFFDNNNDRHGAVSYLRYFGFFDYIEGMAGRSHQIKGNDNYLPVHVLYRDRSNICTKIQGEALQERIDRESEHLAAILTPGEDDYGPAHALTYSFREIIRNCFEHGAIDQCLVMGQRWGNGTAEVAILDQGIGIYDSLRTKYSVTSARQALKLALRPGVTSGAVIDGSKWENSGFGLYVVSELGKRYGEFSIVSSREMLTIVPDTPSHIETVPCKGTIVRLKLVHLTNDDYFGNILEQIINEGEALAELTPGARRTASKGSRSVI